MEGPSVTRLSTFVAVLYIYLTLFTVSAENIARWSKPVTLVQFTYKDSVLGGSVAVRS